MKVHDVTELHLLGALPDDPFEGAIPITTDVAGFGCLDPDIRLKPEDLPEFPLWTLPDPIGRMVAEIAGSAALPADIPAMMALGVLASACMGKVKVSIKRGWAEPLNLYIAVVAEPGGGKSPALKMIKAPVTQWEQEEIRRAKPRAAKAKIRADVLRAKLGNLKKAAEKAETNAQLEKMLSDAARLQGDIDRASAGQEPPRFLFDDATPEALAVQLAHQPSQAGACLSAEGDLFKHMVGRYTSAGRSGGDLALYKKAWTGEAHHVTRITRGATSLERPILTLLLGVQPEAIRDLGRHRQLRGEGLLARFFYSLPADALDIDLPPDLEDDLEMRPETLDGYEKLLSGLLDLPFDPVRHEGPARVVALSREAAELHYQLRDEVRRRSKRFHDLEQMRDWALKLPGQVPRIAAVLHFADLVAGGCNRPWEVPVTGEAMQRALAVTEYAIAHARAVFDLMHGAATAAKDDGEWTTEDAVQRIVDWLRAEHAHGRDKPAYLVSELYRSTRPTSNPKWKRTQFNGFLASMRQRGLVHLREAFDHERGGKRGPRPQVAELRPALFSADQSAVEEF